MHEGDSDKPSAILLGSKPGSVVALEVMLDRGWRLPFVVASSNNPHPWVQGPTLRERAEEAGIRVLETQEEIPADCAVDFVLSYMFRRLVRAPVLGLARRAALNFHAAPLPEYGGWAFYNVAILEDAREFGCTCHWMSEAFDEGPVLEVRRFPIDASQETALSLERKAQAWMVELFVDFCELAESGATLPRVSQDPSQMRYMNREEFELLRVIPEGGDEQTVDRCARAFWYPPYECASVLHNNVKVEIVPAIAKPQLARLSHQDDLDHLRQCREDHELTR